MNTPPSKILVVLTLGLLALGGWFWFASEPDPVPPERADQVEPAPPALAPRPQVPTRTIERPKPSAPAASALPKPSVEPGYQFPIMPASPDEPHDGYMHPHPITPEHERLAHENQLIAALNDATDIQDPARIRQLIEAYRKAEPEDVHKLQQGYSIIADCLEHPGDASRAAAERYWNEERASTIRRYVRRHCLE